MKNVIHIALHDEERVLCGKSHAADSGFLWVEVYVNPQNYPRALPPSTESDLWCPDCRTQITDLDILEHLEL